jgi:hypothetical protein
MLRASVIGETEPVGPSIRDGEIPAPVASSEG